MTTAASPPIELAREPDFWLGALEVRPSTCQVLLDITVIYLQPKIMQVLIALARAQGRVVSLEELLSLCWGDVVVGDGSVHRCVARLRRLSVEEAPGNFSIVSQSKVGYRLEVFGGPNSLAASDPVIAHRTSSLSNLPRAAARRGGVIGLMGAVTVLLIAFALFAWPAKPAFRIAVRDFKTDGLPTGVAESVANRIAAALSDRDLPTVSRARSSRGDFDGARFIVSGDVQRIGEQININVQMDDASSGLTLWTHTFNRSSSQLDALEDQTAAKVADVMTLTRSWIGPHGDAAKPEVIAAVLKASDLVRGRSLTIQQTREAWRRFRDLAPQSSAAHSAYAMATILGADGQTPEVAAQWRAEAAQDAHQALLLDAKNGEGYLATGLLTPDEAYASQEAWFLKGLAADPSHASLANFLGGLLISVGRVQDGVIWIDRSVKLDPLSGPKTRGLIEALAIAGRFGETEPLIERADRLWPDDHSLTRAILFRRLIYGTPAAAETTLDQFQKGEKPLPGEWAQAWRDFEETRAGHGSASAIAKRFVLMSLSSDGGAAPKLAALGGEEQTALIGALAILRDRNDIFRILDLDHAARTGFDSSVLFEPATASVRSDPRFTKVVTDLGLVRYWNEAKRKPDFCAAQPAVKVCA